MCKIMPSALFPMINEQSMMFGIMGDVLTYKNAYSHNMLNCVRTSGSRDFIDSDSNESNWLIVYVKYPLASVGFRRKERYDFEMKLVCIYMRARLSINKPIRNTRVFEAAFIFSFGVNFIYKFFSSVF